MARKLASFGSSADASPGLAVKKGHDTHYVETKYQERGQLRNPRAEDYYKRLLIGAHFRDRYRMGELRRASHAQPRRGKWLAHPKVNI